MKGKFAAVLTALSLFVQLSNIRFAFAEIIHTSENALPQQIMNSVSASHSLDLISFSPVVADGKTLGALLVYEIREPSGRMTTWSSTITARISWQWDGTTSSEFRGLQWTGGCLSRGMRSVASS